MDREFGTPLIEDFLPTRDLRLVEDTSGAYIPGHGTPTVIIVGRNRPPVSDTVRAVLGVRGEPGRPEKAAEGHVWTSIVDHVSEVGWDDEWISVVDLDRKLLATHPWTLRGGGAIELLNHIEGTANRLSSRVSLIGRTCHTGSDEAYFAPPGTWARFGVSKRSTVPLVGGDVVRDWHLEPETEALFPYDKALKASLGDPAVSKLLWRNRAGLSEHRELGGTHEEIGLTWYEYSRWHPERYGIPLGIALAFVATHNHFVLDRGGKVFKQSAPVIKLPQGASEDEHQISGSRAAAEVKCQASV